jgi:nicotinamidase-related amidase
MSSTKGPPHGLNHINFEYYLFEDGTSQLPNINKFKTLYIAGISLDQCVYHTRSLSYRNVKHKNKKLILDCCIQGRHPDPRTLGRRAKDLFSSLEDIEKYTNDFLIKKKINYIESLIE